jgi:hypothetical protein
MQLAKKAATVYTVPGDNSRFQSARNRSRAMVAVTDLPVNTLSPG